MAFFSNFNFPRTTVAPIRNELQHNKTVTINGYITRRVVNNASRIEIQLTVTELVGQNQYKYSDEELKRIELQQTKAAAGFRDVQGWIKEQILLEKPFKIGVVIGKTAIIDADIKHQLRESIAFYQLDFHRINLSSEAEILSTMKQLDENRNDIIVVSRGGGDNLEIFNKLTIAEQAINLQALFITAIGHKDDFIAKSGRQSLYHTFRIWTVLERYLQPYCGGSAAFAGATGGVGNEATKCHLPERN